ncbi:MAG: hypothetical protein O8C63_11850 [Candidatus Methanoperedens sp.]|nr:hypothetical protein [Candidatus Methanoperedens sp.]
MADNNIVEKLRADLIEKAKEIERIYGLLKSLKSYDESIEIPDIAKLITSESAEIEKSSGSSIRPDEFYGLSNTDATERYLKKIGHAVSLEEIYNALMKGGVVFTGNGRNNLNIMLTRATRKFAKIVSDSVIHFGLLEWYPSRRKRVVGTATPILDEEELPEEETKEDKEKGE